MHRRVSCDHRIVLPQCKRHPEERKDLPCYSDTSEITDLQTLIELGEAILPIGFQDHDRHLIPPGSEDPSYFEERFDGSSSNGGFGMENGYLRHS